MSELPADILERFAVGPTGCWLWHGAINRAGYGTVNVRLDGRFRSALAHRHVYELLVEPIAPGLTLDHLCRTRHCVNPAHMEPVTAAENMSRADRSHMGIRNREKTHCPQGHAYDEANTYRVPGHRQCRTCARVAMRALKARRRLAAGITTEPNNNRDKTACVHGHPFDAANTYHARDGGRRCRTCHRDQVREAKALRRAALHG